ncbi:hypothetical protein [Haloferax denitrificans]|uniref:hypothetical protein n=1 Tax=Haloferax denitrificans TaxID=35745 RepID=UPI001EF9FE43|nr:hypothetical protein [Haloferax denitrificans]
MLVVTSGATAPVSAQTIQGDCDPTGLLVNFIGGFIGTVENPDYCRFETSSAVEELQELDGEQEELDIYNAALQQRSETEVWSTTYDNYVNDTESVAWMKAQVAVAEAYENGSSEAVARSRARQAIADYYAVKQVNLLEKWNVTASSWDTLRGIAENETNVSADFVHWDWQDGSDSTGPFTYLGTSSHTYSLVNGSTEDTIALRFDPEGSNAHGLSPVNPRDDTTFDHIRALEVNAPNSNYERIEYADPLDYANRLDKINTLNSNLQAESDNFVNATYDDFASGQINSSDVISANTAMFEYGSVSENDSQGFYRSVAALSTMGFATPNMSTSGMMNVSYGGQTYQGLVLAREAPGGSWAANTTYNASNITGPVFLASADGRKVDFAGEFTIQEMTARDGSQVQTQNTTTYVYKSANTSELLAMQEEINQLREEVESRQQSVGGSGGSGGLDSQALGIALLVGAAAVLLIQREGNE